MTSHTVALVMDFQPVVFGSIPESDGLLTRAAAATSTARGRGVQIGYAWVVFDASSYAAMPDTNTSSKGLYARSTDSSPLVTDLPPGVTTSNRRPSRSLLGRAAPQFCHARRVSASGLSHGAERQGSTSASGTGPK